MLFLAKNTGRFHIIAERMTPIITATNLSKTFSFPVKDTNRSWLSNLITPTKKHVRAVHDVSFTVTAGERIALIGPNGAGKSTTIKMLTGILYPTDGTVTIDDLVPWRDRKQLAYRIGTVFGQRSQLLPNLPLTESFALFGTMYDLPSDAIRQRTDELVATFDLGAFAAQPVRKLSLGQRMRAEVAASLIHNPHIIFLDEPTIGLDVTAKKLLRDLLLVVNRTHNTTLFLTSHDVGDIQQLCERTIVINHGTIVKDLPTKNLAQAFAFEKYIDLEPRKAWTHFPALPEGLTYTLQTPAKITITVNQNIIRVADALTALMQLFDVVDVDVYDVNMEKVIQHIYADTAPGT